TICGYPDDQGGPLALGRSLAEIDAACQTANTGRFVDVPTTVGFCMYIRRDALDQLGCFDTERFGHGYGEENDFCLRAAAAGWTHRLACDLFVYHKGQVSFGDRRNTLAAKATDLLLERFPDYAQRVARHITRGETTPARFAVTAELFRQSGLPVILMVTHGLGGGVRRHVGLLVERYRRKAHVLLLESTERGLALSVPALPNHPAQPLPADRDEDLAIILQALHVSWVHIHHLMGIDADIPAIIRRLGVPFDTTVHDYYGICPQINLLPSRHGLYCGEPDIGACNACIARSHHWARDILTWRAEHAWLFRDAERVLCPSQDTLGRLKRYYPEARLVLAPHEPVKAEPWPLRPARPGKGRLRIAVLGTLAEHKGCASVAALAELMDPKRFELHLIGAIDGAFPDVARARTKVTGRYDDADLPALIDSTAPHLIWFPMAWPETFSYTLSAAIASGLPIAAPRIGAFPERLAGRPMTWLAPVGTRPSAWLDLFETIRTTLGAKHAAPVPVRVQQPDFYARDYLARPRKAVVAKRRPRLAIVPERYDNGFPTPCAYIRLLQPLSHPAIGGGFETAVHDCETILGAEADIIITQRFAPPDRKAADRLIAHARQCGATLIYDLDDDLLNIPRSHPDAPVLRPQARIAKQMLLAADIAWVSTAALAETIAPVRADALVIENRLDERIWAAEPLPEPHWNGPVRILAMGTTSHAQDFALIEPALVRLKNEYGGRVSIDILGMTDAADLPPGLNRIAPTPHAARSYAGFVQWLTARRPAWDIGLAPLLDTPFNRSKSALKAMDYAAAGMAVLASDVPVYRGSLADGPAGQLVANTPEAWHAALDWLIRNRGLRQQLARQAREAFLASATLARRPDQWRDALMQAMPLRRTGSAA
ncbi:MAG TPA: glycosyltransferase, partial [Rhodopila sp.]|nr:glycosyltransferase [Rhodopila sp.]